jgi:hypothetical protein
VTTIVSRDTTVIPFRRPEAIDDPLSELAREGARRMLAQVLIAEADSFVAMWKDLKLPDGRDAGASFSSTSSSVAVPLLIAQCHLVRHQPPGRTAYGHALSLLPRDRVSGLPPFLPVFQVLAGMVQFQRQAHC